MKPEFTLGHKCFSNKGLKKFQGSNKGIKLKKGFIYKTQLRFYNDKMSLEYNFLLLLSI